MAIEYKEIEKLIIQEAVTYLDMTQSQAIDFADGYTDTIIDEMWDAFGSAINYHTEEYKRDIEEEDG